MHFRKFYSITAVILTITFFAANLHAGKKPNEKSKETPTAAGQVSAEVRQELPSLEFRSYCGHTHDNFFRCEFARRQEAKREIEGNTHGGRAGFGRSPAGSSQP